jgi:antitoxin CcdA
MRIDYAHGFVHHYRMSNRASNVRRRKRAANLSVDEGLLQRAKRLNLNLSQVLEQGLAEAIRRREADEWLKRNRAALDAYNEHVEKHGVFSEGLRSF